LQEIRRSLWKITKLGTGADFQKATQRVYFGGKNASAVCAADYEEIIDEKIHSRVSVFCVADFAVRGFSI
jgi:hypothetical protein